MTRMVAAMAAMILGGWLMQAPVAAQSSKPDPAKVRAAIEQYIEQDTKLKGGFLLRDAQEQQVRELTLDFVPAGFESGPGGTQVVCVNLVDRNGDRLDVDFYVKPAAAGELQVTDIKIHKVNGAERK